MSYDRIVYVVHHPDKDPMASPLQNQFRDPGDAVTKNNRTRNNRVVSKVTVERFEGG